MKVNEIISSLYLNGFVTIENVFNKDEMINYAKKADNYYLKIKDFESTEKFENNSQVIVYSPNLISYFSEFSKMPVDDKLINILKNIFQDHFILSNWNLSGSKPCEINESDSNIHIDSRIPISNPKNSTHVIAMIALDDFIPENGSTILYSKSHLSGESPRNLSKEEIECKFEKVFSNMKSGDITLFLGQTFHQIGLNTTSNIRWGIIAYYTLWWVKPTYDFTCLNPNGLSNDELMIYGFRSRVPHPFDQNKYTVR
jgi:ectoine hydroxylase-related dioxygenase (phytanoyl-CoA dioxygenase family)